MKHFDMSEPIIAEIVEEEYTPRQATVRHLRATADFLEAHPEVVAPHRITEQKTRITGKDLDDFYDTDAWDFFCDDQSQAEDIFRAIPAVWEAKLNSTTNYYIYTGGKIGNRGVQVWVKA